MDRHGPRRWPPAPDSAAGLWSGDALYFTTGADEQKGVNLRGNPHVIVMAGRNDWDVGLDVVVEGDAVPVTDDALLTSLAAAWTAKALAFAKGSFSQTRHTFA